MRSALIQVLDFLYPSRLGRLLQPPSDIRTASPTISGSQLSSQYCPYYEVSWFGDSLRRYSTNSLGEFQGVLNVLPHEPDKRKGLPVCTGVLDYFPDALAAVAACSKAGNDQHNPGQPLHWAKGKSTDHADCLIRHLMERGTVDTDGVPHSAKVAWRALALLQTEIEDNNKE